MKLLTAAVFCILIITTLAGKTKGNNRPGEKDLSKNSKDVSDRSESSHSDKKKSASNNLLDFRVNAKLGYYYPHHKTQEKVALLDHRNNISVFYDGLSGDTFAFTYETGIGFYIPAGVSDKTWNVKKQSYEDYFRKPVPPKDIILIGEQKGIQFDPLLISDEMAQKLSGILSPLSADYSSQCEALATALYISKITSDKFKTSLAGFEGVVGDVNTVNHGDFKWLIGIYQGLGEFFAPFGGVEALNKKHVHIDFAKILNEVCGIYVLCYLLETLAPKFDLGKISGKQMNNDLEFASLLTKLGGEVDYGADGFIFLLTEITKYHYGASSKENLRAVLVKYCTNPRGSHDKVEEQWLSALGTLRKTLKKLKLEESFERVTKAVDSILDGKWHQKGINMSAVVKDILQIQLPAKADAADKILEKL